MLAPFLLAHLFIPAQKRFFYLGLMLSSVLVSSLYACWQGLHGAIRAGGFITYLELSGNLSQLLPVLALLLVEKTSDKYDLGIRALAAASLLICTTALILTGTRGAWLAVGFAVLIYLLHYILSASARKSYRVFSLLLLLLVTSSVAFSYLPAAQKRMASLANPSDYSVVTRFAMWTSASRMIADHPVMGVGLSNYADRYLNQYFNSEPWEKAAKNHDGLTHKHPHNSFLYLLAETGVIGFFCYLLLMGYVFWHFICMWHKGSPHTKFFAKMALLLLTSYLAFAMTENLIFGMYSAMQSFWFLLGMLWLPYEGRMNG
jgi:O-antigen ligase